MADRDITGHTGTCPDVSRRDITGQGSLDLSRFVPASEPAVSVPANGDPSAAWRSREKSRAGWLEYERQWDAWVAAGKPGDPPWPAAGLLSAGLEA